jgi:hypothetical protein
LRWRQARQGRARASGCGGQHGQGRARAAARHERLGRGARTSGWAGAANQTTFFDTFIATMAKLERIRIKTVTEGEI